MSVPRRDFFRLGLGGMAALGAGSCQAVRTSRPTRDTLLLAIDDHWLPFRHCLCYYFSKPRVRPAPVLLPRRDDPNAPDRLAAFFYGTVLHDQGKLTPSPGLSDPQSYPQSSRAARRPFQVL